MAEEKTRHSPLEWLAITLLLGLSTTCLGLALPWSWVHNSTASAWVQAIGSILAILVSAGVVWWQVSKQHRLGMQAELKEELRVIEGFTGVAVLAQGILREVAGALAEPPQEEATRSHLVALAADTDIMVKAMEDVDAGLMSQAHLNLALRAVRKCFIPGHNTVISVRTWDTDVSVDLVNRAGRALIDSANGMRVNHDVLVRRATEIRQQLGYPLET